MRPATHESALRVKTLLGGAYEVLEFEEGTRTAAEAAAAIGCTVAQIAKSILFRAEDGTPVLAVLPGDRQVDERRLAALVGRRVARADAAFVREATGYPIGGVAPVGHRIAPEILLDPSILDHPTVWAAAGTPTSVVGLPPKVLVERTGGRLAPVAREAPQASP